MQKLEYLEIYEYIQIQNVQQVTFRTLIVYTHKCFTFTPYNFLDKDFMIALSYLISTEWKVVRLLH